MNTLAGRVAMVAGATRGAGRGIARMLGEAGATVYCTGRNSRTQPDTSDHAYAKRPETIEETAEMVDAAGGTGIPVRVDHHNESEVAALFKRVKRESKRLDVLVNILTGRAIADWKPFHKLSLDKGRAMFDSWLWSHVYTCWHAAPLMIANKSGLIVEVLEHDSLGYHAQLFYDLAILSIKRLNYGLAEELAPKGISAVTIAPGFMRTEAILEGFGVTESNWKDAIDTPQAKSFGFAGSETPCFVGRAVAALAADPDVARWSGGVYSSWALSEEYGFTDVDGAMPHWGRYGMENFPHIFGGKPQSGKRWEVVHVG
jgi:NAD(P)-dependent dehydrogenase (short-subunit alcohol dehydrogenase family)